MARAKKSTKKSTGKKPAGKATPAQRRRRIVLALVAAAAVSIAVGLVLTLVWIQARKTPSGQQAGQQPGVVVTPPTTPGKKPRPEFQDASCPDVQMVVIPGTWESSPTDDTAHPGIQFPHALLLPMSRVIGDDFGTDRVQVYTVPYTAQFHNPFAQDNQISYNASRDEGNRATKAALAAMAEKCPLTSYVLVGFSQGAVIAGDIAGDIGNGRGPVDEDLVLGVTLIADGRRQTGVGQHIGPDPAGQGAEITLAEVPFLSGMGLTMTGPRPGGFGKLDDRTNQICAPGDLICDAPVGAFNVSNLPETLNTLAGGAGQPVHAMYGTPDFWVLNGATATDWTQNWAKNLIDNAPHPQHG
ncbi:MAG: cutinase family protein [Mycobacterium sp.]|jgi:hypothetical protein|nr:cutinase family protein [Mycobacterium sp.]